MSEFKTYVGSKIIRACPKNHGEFMAGKGVSADYFGEPPEGYHVIYPDGYESWSPKAAFEEAYRLVSPAEKELIDIT